MFWVCIEYSGARIHHVFRRCGLLYNRVWPNRIHLMGDAICGVSFSDDTSENRTDTIWGVIIGVDSRIEMQPLDACEKCQAERVRLAETLAAAVIFGGRGGSN